MPPLRGMYDTQAVEVPTDFQIMPDALWGNNPVVHVKWGSEKMASGYKWPVTLPTSAFTSLRPLRLC